MKILVVDDDRVSLRMISGNLTNRGHEVVMAGDGLEALKVLEKEKDISMIITDWIMPKMDGLVLCRKARELHRSKYLPILLFTSRSEKEDLIEGLNAGADAFLNKPLNFAELQAHLRVIERILDLEKRLAGQLLDLGEAMNRLKEAHAKIEEIARTDELTQLPNRRNIMERLEYEIGRAERYNSKLSVYILDIDHFKKVNDEHGHLTGDSILKEFGKILCKSMRRCDLIGRYGGEEFLGLLPEVGIEGAKQWGDRTRKIVEEMVFPALDGDSVHITISIGIARYLHHKDNSTSILTRADNALYQAKKSGRNCVCLDDPT